MSANIFIQKILKEQYFHPGENSWEDICKRLVTNFIKFDKGLEKYEDVLYNAFKNKLISLNSPALMNIGSTNQCSACFILDVEDSLESIYNAVKESALLFKSGAGVGLSLSKLREKGAELSNGGTSSGVISWLEQFNEMISGVKQGGKRRGAFLATLSVEHPDIFDFINCKTHKYVKEKYSVDDDYTANILFSKLRPFSNMNLTVVLTEEFLYAVKNNLNFNLISPKNRKVVRQVSARELFDNIIRNMYFYGEPGIMFDERINSDNPVPESGKILSGNPCAEYLGIPYTCCVLGTLNLYNILKYYNISFHEEKFTKEIKELIYLLVRLLDNIIDINNLPIQKLKENSTKIRPIGVGVMDLAGAMIADGVTYGNNKKCVKYINNLFYNIRKEVIKASIELAKEKGKVELPNLSVEKVFKGLDLEKEASLVKEFQKFGIRNANLLSIPPTGATGLLYEANAGGIEPIYSLSYNRTILGETYKIYPKVLKDVLGVDNIPENFVLNEKQKNLLVTTPDLSPEDHLVVLNEVSKYVDLNISKTINFPADITIQEMQKYIEEVCFNEKYKHIKSLTIYRDNPQYSVLSHSNSNHNISFIGVVERPNDVEGVTSKLTYGDKKIYITVNFFNNRPIEVWLDGGNPGEELNAILWAFGWFISKYLQYGLPLDKMFQKMLKVNTSERVFNENMSYSGLINLIFLKIYDIISKRLKNYFVTQSCPKCNSSNFVLESGCWKCYNCGYSKCN